MAASAFRFTTNVLFNLLTIHLALFKRFVCFFWIVTYSNIRPSSLDNRRRAWIKVLNKSLVANKFHGWNTKQNKNANRISLLLIEKKHSTIHIGCSIPALNRSRNPNLNYCTVCVEPSQRLKETWYAIKLSKSNNSNYT